MNDMKRLMLMSLMCLIGFGVLAQKSKTTPRTSYATKARLAHKSDPKSVAILSKVNKKYAAYKSMKIDLVVTIADGDYKETQQGKVYVKGNKFKIVSKDQEIVSDGKTNWVYLKRLKELQISNPDPDDIALFSSPDKLLKSYEKDFTSALIGEATEGGKSVYKIEFKPKDRNSEYSKVRVTIAKNTFTINKIKVFDKSNIHYTVAVKSFVRNSSLSDSFFTFDTKKVPKDNIMDLR